MSIIKNVYQVRTKDDKYYEQRGRLAKGKVHCSCPMCRTKSYDSLSARDKRYLIKMQQDLEAYQSFDLF